MEDNVEKNKKELEELYKATEDIATDTDDIPSQYPGPLDGE